MENGIVQFIDKMDKSLVVKHKEGGVFSAFFPQILP